MFPPKKKSNANILVAKMSHLSPFSYEERFSFMMLTLFFPRNVNLAPSSSKELLRELTTVYSGFPLLQAYYIEKFLFLDVLSFPEAVRLFYANMTISNGVESGICSYVLRNPIEFSLALLFVILNLLNIGNHCYLFANVDLPAFGTSVKEVYLLYGFFAE